MRVSRLGGCLAWGWDTLTSWQSGRQWKIRHRSLTTIVTSYILFRLPALVWLLENVYPTLPATLALPLRAMSTRPQWLSSLTQHGSKPPYLLKFRSSKGFIISTVALAVFTVIFSVFFLHFRPTLRSFAQVNAGVQKLTEKGHVFICCHCASDSIRITK